jgi:DNA ligase-1
MLNPWEVVSELESDNSRLFKESVVAREAAAGNAEFFRGARAALDSLITYGIKQVPEKTKETKTAGLPAESFWKTAQQLAERKLTGNAAITAVNMMMSRATQLQWNGWYRRILIKDLRCGVSEKTINKAVEKINTEYVIPVFACQLAYDSANHESKITGEKLIEVKLDGVRVITVVYPNGQVDQYSRNGKELVNFEHIKKQIAKHAVLFAAEPVVLDGEVMSSSFQDLMKQVHRKTDVAANDAVLHVFDALTLKEFQQGRSTRTQLERSRGLIAWYNPLREHMPNVAVVGQELVDLDTAKGQERFKMINTQAVAGGYEGIMIKDPEAVYECKRSVAWLKLKPFIEVSLSVVAVEEGTGRNAGRLGAIICEGEDDGRTIRVNVGSGFSDADRDNYWASRAAMVGNVVEVRADAVTQNQDGTYSLRFPRFLHFRGFVPGEKL